MDKQRKNIREKVFEILFFRCKHLRTGTDCAYHCVKYHSKYICCLYCKERPECKIVCRELERRKLNVLS